MSRRKSTSKSAEKRITKYIDELKSLEQKCYSCRTKDWAAPYLERVYRLHCNWVKKGLRKERRADLAALGKPARAVRKDKTALHLLLDHTSGANTKTKSRWVAALRGAGRSRIEPDEFIDYLLSEGGIAGRAKEYAASKKTSQPKHPARAFKRRPFFPGRPPISGASDK